MRIGVITFHCAYNYGSALQTYALKRFLEQNGHQVNVIHYLSHDFRKYHLMLLRRDPCRLLRDLLTFPFVRGRNTVWKEIVKDILFFSRRVKRKKHFQGFWSKYFDLTERFTESSDLTALNARFDVFICGSDQIWNLDCTNGIIEPFFLSFAQKPRIAYAPSLGHTQFRTPFDEMRLRELLGRLDAISVREKRTLPLLRKYTDREAAVVLDPTLLLKCEDYAPLMETFFIDAPYLFCYEIPSEENRWTQVCHAAAKKRGWKIVYFSERNRYGRDGISAYGCTPGQWLYLLAHAEAVASNSFHATVFSILFARPFTVFPTKRSGSRVTDLLESLGMSAHITQKDAEPVFPSVNSEKAVCGLEPQRCVSESYLRSALNHAGERYG